MRRARHAPPGSADVVEQRLCRFTAIQINHRQRDVGILLTLAHCAQRAGEHDDEHQGQQEELEVYRRFMEKLWRCSEEMLEEKVDWKSKNTPQVRRTCGAIGL